MTENDNEVNSVEILPEDDGRPQQTSKAATWIDRIRRVFLVIGIVYVGAVLLLGIPFFQRQ